MATQLAAPTTRHSVGSTVGFFYVALALGVTMVGTTLPTPLYPLYQRQLGFGSLLITLIYAVYAAGVIAALLFGQASNTLGRRRILLAALAASAASAVIFLAAGGVPALFAARVLSGLSAGMATGTATVALVELAPATRRTAATLLATVVNMFGLGCGPLLSGLLAKYVTMPLTVPFIVDLALIIPAAIGIVLTPETAPMTGAGALPRPQWPSIAAASRPIFGPAAIAAFAAFAAFGLLSAVEPTFLASVLHHPDPALAGAAVFSMFAGSVAGQFGLARISARAALPVGCLVLIAGLACVAAGLFLPSLTLLIVGTIVIGVGQSLSFRAGMAGITASSPENERAQTVASFFIVAYVGISLPVILVGIATTQFGLRNSGIVFTVAVALLALVALLAVGRLERRRSLAITRPE